MRRPQGSVQGLSPCEESAIAVSCADRSPNPSCGVCPSRYLTPLQPCSDVRSGAFFRALRSWRTTPRVETLGFCSSPKNIHHAAIGLCRGLKQRLRPKDGSVMAVTVCFGLRFWGVLAWPANALAQSVLPSTPYAVGMTQVEFVGPADGGRPLDFMLIYPAAPDKGAIPYSSNCSWPRICTSSRTRRSWLTS